MAKLTARLVPRLLGPTLLGLSLALAPAPLAGQIWSAANDFSATSNPTGPWSYGWSATLGGPITLYTLTEPWPSCGANPDVISWYEPISADPTPHLTHNGDGALSCPDIHLLANDLVMHPGPGGQYSVLRWIAPTTGVFMVMATFAGRDADGASTDVHILHNGALLFSGTVTGTDIPTGFQSGCLALNAGDSIDFLVGYGTGGYFNDTTAIDAVINQSTTVQFTSSSFSVLEEGGTATITVNRSGCGADTGSVSVDYVTTPGSAIPGFDYTSVSGTITFNSDEIGTKAFAVPILDDSLNESSETVILTLSNVSGSGALGSPGTATLTILTSDTGFQGDEAGLPQLSHSSIAWGDVDNDEDLDILLTGLNGVTPLSGIYRNDSGVFVDIGAGLEGLQDGSIAWGDLDNDGDLDILLTGMGTSTAISRIYRNDGGSFPDIGAGLPGVSESSVAWGDYDNDGDLDLALTGVGILGDSMTGIYRNDDQTFLDIGASLLNRGGQTIEWGDYDNDEDLDLLLEGIGDGVGTRVYRNDGLVFVDSGVSLVGSNAGVATWGDYDADGDLDIAVSGAGPPAVCRVYRNEGGGIFLQAIPDFQGGRYGSAAWGDCDNDGDLDILITGLRSQGIISRVYRNDGVAFVDLNTGLTGVEFGSGAWGDYDNDGDLDILVVGQEGSGAGVTRLYENILDIPPNSPPSAPTNLASQQNGLLTTFSWDPSFDGITPSPGLSYNLRIGTTPGGEEIASAMANGTNGYRRVVQLGNAQKRTSWTIQIPADIQYYWSVQAIDGAFSGSAFVSSVTAVGDNTNLPMAYELRIPNPFQVTNEISYALSKAGYVSLDVIDLGGRHVRGLVHATRPAGLHSVQWDGRSDAGIPLASGVYFMHFETLGVSQTRRLVLVHR